MSGRASFIVGGNFGSEAKGAAAAFVATHLQERGEFFDIVTTNAAAQAGHTSVHEGTRKVLRHLPTIPLYSKSPTVYINAGAVIDVDVLLDEIRDNPLFHYRLAIHPRAVVITDECRAEEMALDSMNTRTGSTRKGVGAALARKVMRTARLVQDEPRLAYWVQDINLNRELRRGRSVAVEVPQGLGLSLNSKFYPYVTSRNCTIQQAMSDADIHPQFYGRTMLVLRTFPIRVGDVVEDGVTLGTSGGCYPDQREITWEELGVAAEITTVTRRVRRVFTLSRIQVTEAVTATRPDVVFMSFCDYSSEVADELARTVEGAARACGIPCPKFIYAHGPATSDVTPF